MKSAVWIYSLITVLFLFSCFGPGGPDMDEDYAGNWYTTTGGIYGTEEIVEISDTTFSLFIRYTDGNYYRGYKGFVERTSDTTIRFITTEIFIFDDAWADSSYIYPNSYDGEYRNVDFVTGNTGTNEDTHYNNMVIDSDFSYGWLGNDLVIEAITFTAIDPISDSIPE